MMNTAATAMSSAVQLFEERFSFKVEPDRGGNGREGGSRQEADATSAAARNRDVGNSDAAVAGVGAMSASNGGRRREADATSATARGCSVSGNDVALAACIAAAAVLMGRQHCEAMPIFLKVVRVIKDLPTPTANNEAASAVDGSHQVCFQYRAHITSLFACSGACYAHLAEVQHGLA